MSSTDHEHMGRADETGAGHLGASLSAYLDGELAPAAQRAAEAHLTRCGTCQAELDEVSYVRLAIHALAVRACPPGVLALTGKRPARRGVWAAVAVAAAVGALLLPSEPEVTPVLPRLVDSHAARASMSGDPLSQLAPVAVPVRFGW